MRRGLAALLVAGAAAAPLAAAACGVCAEDKVAATYDHAVVTGAAGRGHVVVFAAIEGRAAGAAMARDAKAAAARVRGVERGSVRAAAAPAALSFAIDPRIQAPQAALAAVEKAAPGLKLTLLRVMP